MKISLRSFSHRPSENLSHILLASAHRTHARSTHGALRDCSLKGGDGAGGPGREMRESAGTHFRVTSALTDILLYSCQIA